ncbi:hypothetical protein MXL46_11280 [Heyndrickxia sporothermodurans]|nr:hypothetical protein [Heyndrickxia sporothermodurans]MEB6549668.1 hypothetical protein [Heyndrickxia sporothermodurans]
MTATSSYEIPLAVKDVTDRPGVYKISMVRMTNVGLTKFRMKGSIPL